MDIFGFLATIVICATVVASLHLITRTEFTFRIVKRDDTPKEKVRPQILTQTELKKIEADLNKPNNTILTQPTNPSVEVKNMDAVIKAANELMGIRTEINDQK